MATVKTASVSITPQAHMLTEVHMQTYALGALVWLPIPSHSENTLEGTESYMFPNPMRSGDCLLDI